MNNTRLEGVAPLGGKIAAMGDPRTPSFSAVLYLCQVLFCILLFAALVESAAALDHVRFEQGGRETTVSGKVLVTAQDGGLLLLATDGVLWIVQPNDLIQHTADDSPFVPLTADEMSRRVLGELPRGFEVHRTAHYLIFHNTSRDYATWCGSLFERLYMAFTNFWARRGFELQSPEFPLVAILFADKAAYSEFAKAELGEGVQAIIGYFSLRTNRITMFDLTGMVSANRGGRGGSAAQINRILSHPDSERNVATIVHEATHQIAFNCGLHTRYSDCPLWFSEGIALYFETPDLTSAKGWSTIGSVNRPRLQRFQEYASRRPPDSLLSLVRDDVRLRDTKNGLDAYAEAWALTYFLLKQQPKQYLAYLKTLSAKKPMEWDDPETRLHEFQQAFGSDLRKLDAEMTRYMLRLK